jgi:hypothetical protein
VEFVEFFDEETAISTAFAKRPRWTLVDAAWTPKPGVGASKDNGTTG